VFHNVPGIPLLCRSGGGCQPLRVRAAEYFSAGKVELSGHRWGDRTSPEQEDSGPGAEEAGRGRWGELRGLHLRTSGSAPGVGDCSLGWKRLSSVFSSAGGREPEGLRCAKWDLDGI